MTLNMSGALPTWLEQWLGLPTAGPGQGTAWSLESSWGWAPWMTLLFALFAIAWVSWFYASEGPSAGRASRVALATIRLLLVLLVGLMLAELMISLRRTGLPTVVVLVDDSLSMGIEDRYDDKRMRAELQNRLSKLGLETLSRFNLAKSVLLDPRANLLKEIEKHYQLELYLIGSAVRAQRGDVSELGEGLAKAEPVGESSWLGTGVRDVLSELRGTSPAAMIILTDGITTDGESLGAAARFARRKGVPIFAVGLGSEEQVRDVELRDLLVDEVVFVDDVVSFEATVAAPGYAGKTIEVVLKEQGKPAVLSRAKLKVKEDGEPQKVNLQYRPTEIGEFEFVVEVEPLADEAQKDNNSEGRLVSVRKEEIRVLYVQAYPNYEFRYLKNMLERDNTIRLHTLLQDADLEFSEQDASAIRTFPVKREDLFEYDVLMLGDVNPQFLSANSMQNIADFVQEKGGGAALIAGPRYMPTAFRDTPIAPLIPLELASVEEPPPGQPITEGFVMQPTGLGLASSHMQLGDSIAETEQIWQNLPPLYWMLESAELKPAARVLAEHPTRLAPDGRNLPLVCLQYVGAGKVLWHSTDETWRWRYRVGDVLFARYWVQAIRFLSRSKLLGKDRAALLTVDRREYRRGEHVQLRARFIDERQAPADDQGVTVVVERAGHKNRRVTLSRNPGNRGVFEGTLENALDGKYHAWIATPTLEGQAPSADFLVTAPPGEFQRVQLDSAALREATEETRGKYYTIATAGKLARDLPSGRQVPIEALPPEVLWNKWWVLLTFLCLLTTEWVLRKRVGLV